MTRTALIARCPVHGLHGERETCFVCDGPVERIPMVPESALVKAEEERDHFKAGVERLASHQTFTVALDLDHSKPEALAAELRAMGGYAESVLCWRVRPELARDAWTRCEHIWRIHQVAPQRYVERCERCHGRRRSFIEDVGRL